MLLYYDDKLNQYRYNQKGLFHVKHFLFAKPYNNYAECLQTSCQE